jgi:Tfp pilus assembly PilM family ATPase
MGTRESVLGLAFTDKGVQAVEIEHDGPSNTLLAIDEWENTLADKSTENGHDMEQFAGLLGTFLKVNKSKARKVSVALDTTQLFLNTIPIEDGLSRPEINDHLNWELRQYFPDAPANEYITDTHVLTRLDTEKRSDVLCVSVRREHAYAIQKALSMAGLSLDILDVDHFSADTALRINYPDSTRKHLAFVGVKENRLDVSIIRLGNVESYSYVVVNSNQEIVDRIAAISQEIRGLHSITAYGPYLDKDLLVQIRRGSSLLVEALNPLRHVNVSDTLRLADHLTVPSYRFAAAVGVALRRE